MWLLALAVEEAAAGAAAEAVGDAPGDERLLRRALSNLLENARRYGAGSPVTVELARSGPTLELRVSDRGPGVPEPWRERIFEPFLRLAGHAEQAGGIGLGLSLVRQIAQAHAGRAEYRARPGRGSCFVRVLPRGG